MKGREERERGCEGEERGRKGSCVKENGTEGCAKEKGRGEGEGGGVKERERGEGRKERKMGEKERRRVEKKRSGRRGGCKGEEEGHHCRRISCRCTNTHNIHFKTFHPLPQIQYHFLPTKSTTPHLPRSSFTHKSDGCQTSEELLMQRLALPRDAVRGHLACLVRSSFLPGRQVHFMQATLVLHAAGISQLPQDSGWMFQTSQRFPSASAHACLHSKTWAFNFTLFFFLFSSYMLGLPYRCTPSPYINSVRSSLISVQDWSPNESKI